MRQKKVTLDTIFLAPLLYIGPPSTHYWALESSQDKLVQLQKVGGVTLSDTTGVLQGKHNGGVVQATAIAGIPMAF